MAPVPSIAERQVPPPPPVLVERVFTLDAFRGFTMVCLIAEGFGLLHLVDHSVIGRFAEQFQHRQWEGLNAWDLVQPFFMFIVGAVMPASFAARWAAGETWAKSLRHVLRRCALLILLGLLARSIQAGRPVLDVINVLGQLAFTYLVAFLVLRQSWKVQLGVALGLLAAHWALFQFVTLPGVAGPWARDANIGSVLDHWILGKNWRGSYVTINCLSSAANTLFGVLAGSLVLAKTTPSRKVATLALGGAAGIAAGLALSPFIPIIKKIWTPSFALYSGGITLLALLLFYWLCDVRKLRAWARVFVIVGSNSIFIYLLNEILREWLNETALVFTRPAVTAWGPWGLFLTDWVVILFEIYVCWWLYRRKIFLRI